jgi:hypothetical protein
MIDILAALAAGGFSDRTAAFSLERPARSAEAPRASGQNSSF